MGFWRSTDQKIVTDSLNMGYMHSFYGLYALVRPEDCQFVNVGDILASPIVCYDLPPVAKRFIAARQRSQIFDVSLMSPVLKNPGNDSTLIVTLDKPGEWASPRLPRNGGKAWRRGASDSEIAELRRLADEEYQRELRKISSDDDG